MGNGIINLTRKILPKISINPAKNIESINSMPEMVLGRMLRSGDKSILYVDMNHCGAAIINQRGINTVYTDALNGCNSVGAALKLNDGRPLFMLSHYVPTNVDGQVSAISKQLNTYKDHLDSAYTPRLFFNIRGYDDCGKLETVPNPIVEKVKNLFSKMFSKDIDASITPYQNQNRPAFFSSANIFQFNPENLNKVKITNVGEKEVFVDLMT